MAEREQPGRNAHIELRQFPDRLLPLTLARDHLRDVIRAVVGFGKPVVGSGAQHRSASAAFSVLPSRCVGSLLVKPLGLLPSLLIKGGGPRRGKKLLNRCCYLRITACRRARADETDHDR